MKSIFQIIGLALVLVLAGSLTAAALDGFVVIANKSVPETTLGAAALKDIYTGKSTYWDDGQRVVIIVLADKSGDAALNEASGMDASQFKTFWQRMVFSGRGQQPRRADNAASLVAQVAATKGAIALAPANADLKDVTILKVK
jgi:ABC-type phosphate transport system substrate-binding protein